MPVLLETPNFEFFSQVPHLHEAVDAFERVDAEEKIVELGKIFVKYNCFNDFGLTIVHRHFDMDKQEILVESINPKKTVAVSIPWKLEGICSMKYFNILVIIFAYLIGGNHSPVDMDYWKSFGFEEKSYIVPKTWAFTSEKLEAFEFICNDTNFIGPDENFVKEVYEFLQDLGLLDIVGLRRLHGIGNSYETTPEGVKANVVKFGQVPPELQDDMIKVAWSFNEKGEMRGDQACIVCWCNHSCTSHSCSRHTQ